MTYPKNQITKNGRTSQHIRNNRHVASGSTALRSYRSNNCGRSDFQMKTRTQEHLLWISSTAISQSVQPPCGRSAHNTPVVPIILTAQIDFTKTTWFDHTNQTRLPNPMSITHHTHGTTSTWSLNLPLDEYIDKLRKSMKVSLSLKNPTWSKE